MVAVGGHRANRKRSEQRRAQRLAELAWEREHPWAVDREWFGREVLPGLSGLSAGAIARATRAVGESLRQGQERGEGAAPDVVGDAGPWQVGTLSGRPSGMWITPLRPRSLGIL